MVLPSNDAFVGTAAGVRLFNDAGHFLGESTTVFSGDSVRDAGTEYNTELDAAFINQTAPNTGLTEGGVVRVHEGFNGSAGNPDGILSNIPGSPGDQIILGGTNAFGDEIVPEAADFTLPGAEIAVVHINKVVETTGTPGRDVIRGGSADDLIDSGSGNDIISSGNGWDVVNSGSGNDIVFTGNGDDAVWAGSGNDHVSGGQGDDVIDGGDGNDLLFGNNGADSLSGGNGRDLLSGGDGGDALNGGAGSDILLGGQGNDNLSGGASGDLLSGGSGNDLLDGGDGKDRLFGGFNNDTILGGAEGDLIGGQSGNDRIEGGTGDDFIFGGSGNDTFVFSGGDGDDVIRDFGIGTGFYAAARGSDTIELDVAGIDNFHDLQAAATQRSYGTELDFGSEGSIRLVGVAASSLNADDFVFV